MTALSRANVRTLSIAVFAGLVASTPVSNAVAAGREYVVPMANMSFGPIPTGLKAGDTIVFVNKDSVPHTVTARNHSFDLRIGPGQSRRLNLTKAGSYPIYCILHAPMRATITVGT